MSNKVIKKSSRKNNTLEKVLLATAIVNLLSAVISLIVKLMS